MWRRALRPRRDTRAVAWQAHCNRRKGEEWMGARRHGGRGSGPRAAASSGRGGPRGRGALGLAIHWRLSRLDGAERDMAEAGDAAGWDCPCTGGAQNNQDWRAAWRSLEAWRVGSGQTRTTAKAAWFGGGGRDAEPHPPPFYRLPNLIRPPDIFEVKVWRAHAFGPAFMLHEVRSTCALTEKGSRTSFQGVRCACRSCFYETFIASPVLSWSFLCRRQPFLRAHRSRNRAQFKLRKQAEHYR
jgi:hypothetical protein